MKVQSKKNSTYITALLIDDNHVNNKLVASILMPHGFDIYIADKGRSGIRMAVELSPDVILLDIMMPEIDGFQVCKHLQNDPRTHDIPVIFITADASVKTQSKAFQIGGSDFITKPIVDVVLVERIRNQVRLNRNKKELAALNKYHELAGKLFETGFWAFNRVNGIDHFTWSQQLGRILDFTSSQSDEAKSHPFNLESLTTMLEHSKDSNTRSEYFANWCNVLTYGGVFDEICNCPITENTKYLRIHAEIKRKNGDCFSGFGAVQDVTGIIQTENELAMVKAELERIASRHNLVEANTQLAHEINQPLAAINLNLNYVNQLLNAESIDLTKIKEALNDVRNDVSRATNVVKNIRRLVTKEPVSVKPFDLKELLRETVNVFNRELSQKKIELLFDVSEAPLQVVFNRTGLQQVIVNLLKNAIEALNQTDNDIRSIRISTDNQDHDISVSISDNGTGIDSDIQEQIFQQYYTSKTGNTGMGLSICKALMNELDGDICLSEPPDDYATSFKITIPKIRSKRS
jgi:signal transduction histidine kinase/DNA-binding response OmpR family regulator